MQYQINRPDVMRESFEDEDVLVNLETGVYFLLDALGGRILTLLEQGVSDNDVIEHFRDHYSGDPAQITRGVQELIDSFVAESLISPATCDSVAADILPAPGDGRTDFTAPVLQRFTDMQELLLLDPVHEVDDRGWPHASAQAADPD